MQSKQYVLISMLVVIFISPAWKNMPSGNYKKGSPHVIVYSLSDTTYHIIPSINNTYGYEILIDNRVLIRQQNIPAMPGLKGFRRKEDAEKVARLVLKKLAKGIMPPTIEKQELDKLKIKY